MSSDTNTMCNPDISNIIIKSKLIINELRIDPPPPPIPTPIINYNFPNFNNTSKFNTNTIKLISIEQINENGEIMPIKFCYNPSKTYKPNKTYKPSKKNVSVDYHPYKR